MEIINSLAKWWMKKRIHEIEHFQKNPFDVQQNMLNYLVRNAQKTAFGKKYDFKSIKNIRQFQERVPVNDYSDLSPFIDRLLKGEENVLWPSHIKWFAKSSGTTSSTSKLIPVSQEALRNCHYRGGKDMIALYARNYPDTKIFSGKNLSIGGGQANDFSDSSASYHKGNISAIVMQNLPVWAQFSRTPNLEVTMMNDWEEKIQKIAEITSRQKVASMAGSPMWLLLLLQHMFRQENVQYIQDLWPEMEVFFHGGVSFTPYRPQFEQIDRDNSMRYMNIYNATEGFIGLQDLKESEAMLLMLNYGIFYEFIPVEDFHSDNPKVVDLSGVETDKNYSLVISTNSGLWRYKIGDTVRFTSTQPYRFIISGRTKHSINIFGEDLFIDHAEKALAEACNQTGSILENYTAAPRYYSGRKKGCHEWVIEFSESPEDMEEFTELLDKHLQAINDDYASKRQANMAIERPVIVPVPQGTFYSWLKKNDKLGGQFKVPRLSNSREFVEDILAVKQERKEVPSARIRKNNKHGITE